MKRTELAIRLVLLCFSLSLGSVSSQATARDSELPPDPFRSVMWKSMADRFFPDGPIVFDGHVKVIAPATAEDQFHVPVTIDASSLDDVRQIVAVADLNPIPNILTVRPEQAVSFVGFRVKLQQSTPIHVGVQTEDGVWHMGGAYVDAAGGGCTAPAAMHATENWMDTLGLTRAVARRSDLDHARTTIKMRHPMDTGLAAGIPAFYLSNLTVTHPGGELIADVELYEPISENPTLTFLPKMLDANSSNLHVHARDTEGNEYDFDVLVPSSIE